MSAELSAQKPTDYVTSLVAQTNAGVTAANLALENETIYHLIRDNSVSRVNSNIVNGTFLDASGSNVSLNSYQYTSDDLNRCELLTTPGTHDGSFAIGVRHDSGNAGFTSVSKDFGITGCAISKEFSVLDNSTSMFESHLNISYSNNNGPFYDSSGARFGATFSTLSDISGLNYSHFQKMINSHFDGTGPSNTASTNVNPISVVEDVAFNTTYALGQAPTSYFTVDETTGIRTAHDISVNYQFTNNGFNLFETTNLTLLRDSDFGTYRIQQLPASNQVRVSSDSSGTIVDDTFGSKFPVHIGNSQDASGVTQYLLQDPVTPSVFTSLFDSNSSSAALPGYNFNMTIVPGDSGFSFNATNFSTSYKTNDVVTLVDTDLYDNVEIMKDWINHDCKLVYNNGTLTLQNDSDGSITNLTYMLLDTSGENLEQQYIEATGQAIINTRQPSVRTDNSVNTTGLYTYIEYEGHTLLPISEDLKTNYDVEIESELVLKNPTHGTNFLSSGDSTFNLVSGVTSVNSNFHTSNWEFISNVSGVTDNISLFKIVPSTRLSESTGFKDSTDTTFENVYAGVSLQDLQAPVADGEIRGRIHLNLRQASSLNLNTNFTSNNWSLVGPNGQGSDLLYSSSDAANVYDSNAWPDIEEAKQLANGSISQIPYRITFSTGSGSNSGFSNGLNDTVIIEWGTGYTKSLKIPQMSLTRNIISNTVTNTIVSGFTKTNVLLNKDITVYQKRVERQYSVNFNAYLRPYTNLFIESPTYTVRTDYYMIYNNTTNSFYPASFLQYLTGSVNYSSITETIVTNPLTPTVFTGFLVSDDIKSLNGVIQMVNTSDALTTVSDSQNVDIYYTNTAISFDILNTYDAGAISGADAYLWLQYQSMNELGEETTITLNDENGYYITLSNNSPNGTDYQLSYWESSISNFATNTTLNGTTLTLNPSNGFNSVSSWTISDDTVYSIHVSLADNNDTTVLDIKNVSSNSTIYQIKLKNKFIYAPAMYIATGNQDVWRVSTKLNGTISSETYVGTTYQEANYYAPNQGTTPINMVALRDGVYLKSNNAINFDTVNLGSIIKFNLLTDLVSVNMVGSASTTLNEFTNDGLVFQYGDYSNTNFSKTLTFSYYRGYAGNNGTNQHFTITRTKATATLKFINGSDEYSQTVDACDNIALNNFKLNNALTGNYNKLNLKLIFHYSMLPDNFLPANSSSVEYDVYTRGDNVTITITNPREVNYTAPTVINKTLKDYLLYQFSGNNFNNSGEYYTINSSRLRFVSTTMASTVQTDDIDSKMWEILLNDSATYVYLVNSSTGNPENRLFNGQTELSLNTPPSGWGAPVAYNGKDNYNYDDQVTNGIPLANGAFTLFRNPNVAMSESITFIVIARPMLKFTQVGTKNSFPSALPYSVTSTFYTNNLLTYSLPVVASRTYNPFAPSIVYNRLDGVTSVTNLGSQINNITFSDTSNKIFGAYTTSPDSIVHRIPVDSQNITVEMKSKLKTSLNASTLVTLINNVPVSTILSGSLTTITVDTSTSASGAIISFVQTTNPTYLLNNAEIAGVPTAVPNIKFYMPYFFAPNNYSLGLDLPAGPGTQINMYTRDIVYDSAINRHKIAIYKYIPLSTMVADWNDYENTTDNNYHLKTAVGMKFDSRYVKYFNIPGRTIYNTTIETLNDLLNKITYNTVVSAPDWVLDTQYSSSNAPWFSFCSLNIDCIRSTLPRFFSPPNGIGHSKVNIITRNKILLIKDKLGNIVCELDHDAIFRAPFITTGTITLNDLSNYTMPNTYDNIINRSAFGTVRQII